VGVRTSVHSYLYDGAFSGSPLNEVGISHRLGAKEMGKAIEIYLFDKSSYTFTGDIDPMLIDLLKMLDGGGNGYLSFVQDGKKHIIPRHAIARILIKDR
jgi:hypothetical protein